MRRRLDCPACGTPYPRARLLVPWRRHVCPACGARLECSVETAQRMGAVGGLILAPVIYGAEFLVGPEPRWSWHLWASFLVFALLLGVALKVWFARLAPYDEVRRARWDPFPGLSGRPRTFLVLGMCVTAVCAAVLAFARRLPVWVVLLVSLVVMVAGIFSLVGEWHLLFGERGIFRRKDPQGRS